MKKKWQPISATEVAKLLMSFDPDREYFLDGKMVNKTEEEYDPPTIGNFRLNKMLHICQMLHYAKYGKPLFFEDLRAFYHGAIVYPIYRDFFSFYRQTPAVAKEISIDKEKKHLISKTYYYFKNYSDDYLETFSHDDPAWRKTWYEKKADDDCMDNAELSEFYQKLLGHIVKEVELS